MPRLQRTAECRALKRFPPPRKEPPGGHPRQRLPAVLVEMPGQPGRARVVRASDAVEVGEDSPSWYDIAGTVFVCSCLY